MEKSKLSDFIDTEYSSGDSKMMNPKQKYAEENNNEVDELSKEFSEMGCIVDPAQRPNICVETCIYEDSGEEQNEQADRYSDQFEEDRSEDEDLNLEPLSAKSDTSINLQNLTSVKLTKSQSCMSSKPTASRSGRSTGYGSISVPPTRRVNMSFTNERLREIERHNHILLTKILSARNKTKSSIPSHSQPPKRPLPPAAVQRKQMQKKIDHENLTPPCKQPPKRPLPPAAVQRKQMQKKIDHENLTKSAIPPCDQSPKRPLPPAAVQRKQMQTKIDHENLILLKKIQRAKSSAYSTWR